MIKKNHPKPIRKHANVLKVYEKTFRAVIKQDSRPKPPWLCYMGRLRKQDKCNFPSKYWFTLDCYWEGIEWNVWRIYFEGMQIVSKAYW